MLMNKIWRPLQVVSLVRCVRFSNHFIPCANPAPLGDKGIQAVIKGATKAEPFWEEKMTMPIARFIPWLGTKIQWLQQGDFRVYCVYFVIALVAILLSIALM